MDIMFTHFNLKTSKKMKLKFTEQIEKEIEITLPAFRKGSCHFFKVISETKTIQITELDGWVGIGQTAASLAFGENMIESTEQEFEESYSRITNILNDLKK